MLAGFVSKHICSARDGLLAWVTSELEVAIDQRRIASVADEFQQLAESCHIPFYLLCFVGSSRGVHLLRVVAQPTAPSERSISSVPPSIPSSAGTVAPWSGARVVVAAFPPALATVAI